MPRTPALLALALSPTIPSLASPCTREALLAQAASYLAAQTSGTPSTLALSPSNFTYQQNNQARPLSRSLLSSAHAIAHHRTSADTSACASYTLWISTTAGAPYVVGTHLRHADNDTAVITAIDTVAATTGDLFLTRPRPWST